MWAVGGGCGREVTSLSCTAPVSSDKVEEEEGHGGPKRRS